jgi:hypothetical protein
MPEIQKLSPRREAWLRHHIPQWADLRDRAVAAGIIEPEAPSLSQAQAAAVAEIRARVVAQIHKPKE